MKRAIRDHWRDFAAIVGLLVIALGVGGYILSQQRFHLPKSVPFLGSDFVDYKAELSTAKSITPGQGQTVNVAGVPVGEISAVDLKDGVAVVTMKIRRKYTPIYRDASILVRPKTGLEDMVLELIPGNKRAGELPEKGSIPVSRTLPFVEFDEILASLDADTRDYLEMLIGSAGEGLRGQGQRLSATFKRFEPTNRQIARITKLLAQRHGNIERTIHNFSALSAAIGDKDRQLAALVSSSNDVFRAFARQDQNVRAALRELPSTLSATRRGLGQADRLGRTLGPTLESLRPGARALGPSLRQTRPFLRTTTPVIKNQLRPFSRDARPTVRLLRPAARDLAAATPDLTSTLRVVNYTLDVLTYDKAGDGNQPYLFWFAWANRLATSLFATGDAHGPVRRGLLVVSCSGLETLDQLSQVNPQLGLLIKLLDAPRRSAVCPQTSQVGSGVGSTRSRGGLNPLSPDAPRPIRDTTEAAR